MLLQGAPGAAQRLEPAADSRDPPPNPYRRDRWAEDWSHLAGQDLTGARRLKWLPLGSSSHLTIGADLRLLAFYVRNELFGTTGREHDRAFLIKTLIHGDLRLGRWVRVFVQPRSSASFGRAGDPGPLDRDLLGLNAAFIDFYFARPRPEAPVEAALRLGRQELELGSGRLVAYRDGPNVPISFDGARLRVRTPVADVDVFALVPVLVGPGTLDDTHSRGESLSGAATSLRPSTWIEAQLHYLAHRRPNPTAGSTDARHTAGMLLRLQGGALSGEVEVDYQLGRVAHRRVSAWSAAGRVEVRHRRGPTMGSVTAGAGLSTGDQRSAVHRRFVAPYPTGQHLGPLAPGASNLIGASLRALLAHRSIAAVATSWVFFRQTTLDGVYALPGFPLRDPSVDTGARYVGVQLQLMLSYRFAAGQVSLLGAHFLPGAYFAAAPPDVSTTFVALVSNFRF